MPLRLGEIVSTFATVNEDVRQLDVKRQMRELSLNGSGSVEHFTVAVSALKEPLDSDRQP